MTTTSRSRKTTTNDRKTANRKTAGNGKTATPKIRGTTRPRFVVDAPSSKKATAEEKKAAKKAAADAGPRIEIPQLEECWAAIWVRLSALLVNAAGPFTKAKIALAEQGKKTKKAPRKPEVDFMDSLHICVGSYDPSWLSRNIYGFPAVGFAKAMATIAYATGRHKNAVDILRFVFVDGAYRGLVPLFNQAWDGVDIPLVTEDLIQKNMPKHKPTDPKKWAVAWDAAVKQTLDEQPDIYARPARQDDLTYPPARGCGAMMAYRGFFKDAYALLPIRYWPRQLDLDGVCTLVQDAGRAIGVGAWKLEKHGIHGGFEILRVHKYPPDVRPTAKQVLLTPDTSFMLREAMACMK